ncbi:MAG: hypothetical protein JRI23_25560 [Deltaproteobacteria bacterium]|jgi:hypothetical protein|nr:hypothetical protein [Deltaproteobacteria bacterium]MBW2535390.1 hypothetical protein [Deltaproteobacteria bacterium]
MAQATRADWLALATGLAVSLWLARSYSIRLPHTDVQGSFAKALLVEAAGGVSQVTQLWEHRTSIHGFVTYLAHWLGAPLRALGFEHHESLHAVLVLASVGPLLRAWSPWGFGDDPAGRAGSPGCCCSRRSC